MSMCQGFDSNWKRICNEPVDCKHCIFYECNSVEEIKEAYEKWLKECNEL